MLHIVGFNVALLSCFAYCLAFGGAPERVSVIALLIANLVTILAAISPSLSGFDTLASAVALVDFVLLFVLTAIALKANRLWTIALAGLQFATVLIHVVKVIDPSLPATSYAVFAQFWGWPMVILTAIGTKNHRARVNRASVVQDWKPLWPHSVERGFWA